MRVKLAESDAREDLHKIYTACRTCYNAGSPIDMYEDKDISEEKKIKLIKQVINSMHYSVLEHIPLTFFIEGVSRSLLAQFTRHRISVSYSVQSQRYVEFKDGNFDKVIPSKIAKSEEAFTKFNECTNKISETYKDLIDLGIPAEDARAVLPNACTTNISVTMNLRSFIHFCNERCCACAQLEIRKLANEMAKLVGGRYPYLKEYFGPKCNYLGYCPEPAKRSCGRAPLKTDIKVLCNLLKKDTMNENDYDSIMDYLDNQKGSKSLKKLVEVFKEYLDE